MFRKLFSFLGKPNKRKLTKRGFAVYEFKDVNGKDCTLQKSSVWGENYIWLGTESANPKRLVYGKGSIDASDLIPDGVEFLTRMHLNRKQAKTLADRLLRFSETGEL